MILDFSFLDSWREELQEMNGGNKEGRRFVYPDSYIEFLSYLKVGLDIPYRTVQGITGSPSEYLKPMEEVHFTHIRRRMLSMVGEEKEVRADHGYKR